MTKEVKYKTVSIENWNATATAELEILNIVNEDVKELDKTVHIKVYGRFTGIDDAALLDAVSAKLKENGYI